MKTDTGAKTSGGLSRTILVIVLVPLLYLLSVPPILRLLVGSHLSFLRISPAAANSYAAPYIWLEQKTVLQRPLFYYWDLWLEGSGHGTYIF